jgi:hypothetical protein
MRALRFAQDVGEGNGKPNRKSFEMTTKATATADPCEMIKKAWKTQIL